VHFLPPKEVGSYYASIFAAQPIRADLPVEAVFNINGSFKVVNGGGTSFTPSTSVSIFAGVIERNDPNILMVDGTFPTFLLGNEFDVVQIENHTIRLGSVQSPYILAGGVDYDLVLGIEVDIEMFGFGENAMIPQPSITLEFGGISGFDGLSLQFVGQTVPEPTSLAILACPVVFLLVRRKRVGR